MDWTHFDTWLNSAPLLVVAVVFPLIAILAVHFWDQLPEIAALEDATKPGWTVADRSLPAFALSSIDPGEKPVAYATLQHAAGGRKDIFRWTAGGRRPVAELEIYRPGGEAYSALPPPADLALRMPAGESFRRSSPLSLTSPPVMRTPPRP